MSTNTENLSEMGKRLVNKYNLYDVDILHEHYSCTVDFGVEMSDGIKAQLERKGIDVTHERDTIYTLEHEYQA